jgi:hypothetical protein
MKLDTKQITVTVTADQLKYIDKIVHERRRKSELVSRGRVVRECIEQVRRAK